MSAARHRSRTAARAVAREQGQMLVATGLSLGLLLLGLLALGSLRLIGP